MKRRWILMSLALLAGCGAFAFSQVTGGKEFRAAAEPVEDCPADFFVASARVFDAVQICATSLVPAEKLAHAAAVTAEWLDNDGDGAIDEPRILDALRANKATLSMSREQMPIGPMIAVTSDDTRIMQDLWAVETDPEGGRRDASQEEINHLLLNAGWSVIDPGLFGTQPGSAVREQWEIAEREGYYSYDDPTCDATCKVTEFFYLATAAYFGASSDLESDEMRLKNREELAANLPGTTALITSANVIYPTDHWPRGSYAHAQHIVYSGKSGGE